MSRTIEHVSSKFVIRFIHAVGSSERDDELIIVVPKQVSPNTTVASHAYTVTSRFDKKTYTSEISDAYRLSYYVNSLLTLVDYDDHSPAQIQIDLPNAPQVLLSTDEVLDDELKQTILHLLWQACESWPTRTTVTFVPNPPPTPPPANPRPQPHRHLFFNEDTGSVHTEPVT
jgi:hypothetical protein